MRLRLRRRVLVRRRLLLVCNHCSDDHNVKDSGKVDQRTRCSSGENEHILEIPPKATYLIDSNKDDMYSSQLHQLESIRLVLFVPPSRACTSSRHRVINIDMP